VDRGIGGHGADRHHERMIIAHWKDAIDELDWIDKAERYADFLKACGSDIMVIGAPLRQTLGDQPVQFYDFDRAKVIADFLNRLGAT
ncbi:hypothetical protein ACC727_37185, partial [Rhizobium johnstonii]